MWYLGKFSEFVPDMKYFEFEDAERLGFSHVAYYTHAMFMLVHSERGIMLDNISFFLTFFYALDLIWEWG